MSSEPAGTPHLERAANIIPLAGSTRSYWLGHLRDHVLRQGLRDCLRRERGATAELLAHIAEFDARRLYADGTCSSMFDYCVSKLHMSEDAALKRIRVARTAREFPAIFPLLADGRLTLTAVVLLTPRLTAANADALLAAAVGRTNAEIEMMLATRSIPTASAAEPTSVENSGNKVAVRPPVPSDSGAGAHSGEPLFQAAAAVDGAHTDTGFAFMASETDAPLIDDATGNAIVSPEAEEDLASPPSAPASAPSNAAALAGVNVPANVAANRDALAETDLVAIAPHSHGLALYLRFTPVSAHCASLKGMLSLQAMREFKRLQELAGSFGASASAAELLEKAIKAYADALEKRKFGVRADASAGSRAAAGTSVGARAVGGARAVAGASGGASVRAGAGALAGARAGASAGVSVSAGASASASPSTRAKHTNPKRRRIPAAVRRAVYDRDGGQCTFRGSDGTRCACRTALEFDHIQPLARGGLTTVANLRLRCRAHNQLEARRAFGEGFVAGKQEQARARSVARSPAPATKRGPGRVP